MLKAKQITISGSYYTNSSDIESYSGIVGVVPAISDDKATQMVIKRYAKMWLGAAKDLPRVHRIREVFIDNIEEVEGEFSYVGKDIMNMTAEELQDLAAAKDLTSIPLYKAGSLVLARRVAFSEYAIKVYGMSKDELDWRAEGFNPSAYDPIVADASIRHSDMTSANIEESIDRQQLVLNKQLKPSEADTSSRLTLDQLKSIAVQKKLTFAPNVTYKTLYEKIYGKDGIAA